MTKNLRKTIVLVVLALVVLLVVIILLIFIPRLGETDNPTSEDTGASPEPQDHPYIKATEADTPTRRDTPPHENVPTWEEIQELGVSHMPQHYFVPNWLEVWLVHGTTRKQLEEVATTINGVVRGRPSPVNGFIVQLPLCMAEEFTNDEIWARRRELWNLGDEFEAAHPELISFASTFDWSTLEPVPG